MPDPQIEHPADAIVKITSTGICGSDLHLYARRNPESTQPEPVKSGRSIEDLARGEG